ncbi:zinc finger BED domain-containing protein RICESLEEPER 2-like [Raphanus sativus]|uniref:Zinc finger BED domain-containing protein RICESLEEPER 2-like n=1 Tax=Raphanus sativus TaxID=3726 RepID=A0A6J0JKK8_RAPSA|nr:zinc finger BED domain-containing protein RICESLEEPER 2-like [Raphanus sativus]
MDSSTTPNGKDIANQRDQETETQETQQEFASPDNSGKRKEVPSSSRPTSQPAKATKVFSSRSTVWDHYTRTPDNRDKCVCHYCKKTFACPTKSGTSNLQKHLNTCKHYKAWEEGKVRAQPVISEDGYLKDAKVSEDLFKEATNEMLIIGEMPLAFVESLAWKCFCNKMNLPKPHSRRTATRQIVEMYVKRKAALREWFKVNKQRVSLTTDIWIAQSTGASYMVITSHFIDAAWKLKKLILGFKYITDHKGQTISTVLLDCLSEWGIEKVFCITVDNATANTSALRKFKSSFALLGNDAFVLHGDFMHLRCSAHIINLIVKEGLAAVDFNVSAIRKLTRGSLPLDCKTRWNSMYLMLSRAIEFRVAFNKMEAEDRLYNDHFLEFENGIKRIGPPEIVDWNAIERLVWFLIIFYNSTLVVSASTSLNSFKCYGEIVTIEKNLIGLTRSLDSDLKGKAEEMLKKFDKYWDGMRNINKMLIVATVFDPTKKMQFAKMCFEKLYGKDTADAQEMFQSVMDVLRDLFKEYSAWFHTDEGVQASQAPQPASFGSQEQPACERINLIDESGYERMDCMYAELVDLIEDREAKDELETYLKESVVNPRTMLGVEFDVLSWWKVNFSKFPILAEIARDVLAMQVSSVASESAFSTSGRIIFPHRSCLTHYMIEVLMCLEQWMKADLRGSEGRVVTMEQILSEFEYEDKLKRDYDSQATQEE